MQGEFVEWLRQFDREFGQRDQRCTGLGVVFLLIGAVWVAVFAAPEINGVAADRAATVGAVPRIS